MGTHDRDNTKDGYWPKSPPKDDVRDEPKDPGGYSWVAQTRPGGTILTPWASHYHDAASWAMSRSWSYASSVSAPASMTRNATRPPPDTATPAWRPAPGR